MGAYLTTLFISLGLFHWTDIIEVVFFVSAFYYWSSWLAKDHSRNLLFSFYAYCTLICGAYVCSLNTLTHVLFLYSPVTVMLFILFHQTTLQKNFVVAHTITRATTYTHDWLSVVLQSFLTAAHNNKPIVCAIEKYDSLATVLKAPLTFNTTIKKDLLDILLSSHSFDPKKIILISQTGQLLALNASWQSPTDELWAADIQPMETWKQDAILLTNKTDALVFAIAPTTRLFTIIAHKKIIENINAHEAIITIKHYLYGKQTPSQAHKGNHETHAKHIEN